MSDESPADLDALGEFRFVGRVPCVECPSCGFVFDAEDRDKDAHDDSVVIYTCAACGYSADTEMSE